MDQSATTKTATLTIGNESWNFDILRGTTGPEVIVSKPSATEMIRALSGICCSRKPLG